MNFAPSISSKDIQTSISNHSTESLPYLQIQESLTIPGSVVFEIFRYLSAELNVCRLVCKTFQQVIDIHSKDLYPAHLQNIRELYLTFKKQDKLDLPRRNEVEKLTRELEELEIKTKNESEKLKLRINSHWLSYFVSIISPQIGFLAKITQLIAKLFPSIKQEIAEQNTIQSNIQRYTRKIQKLTQELNPLLDEKSNLSFKNRSEAAIAYHHARYQYFEPQHFLSSQAILFELFGGPETFENLPILSGITGEACIILLEQIPTENMTSPIMKGKDIFGMRTVVIIRARNKNRDKHVYEVFHQDILTKSLWYCSGDLFLVKDRFLIREGKAYNQKDFDHIKAFIANGYNDEYILE